MRLTEAQERAAAEQERQRRQQERHQQRHQALIEQRGLFGPEFQQPSEAHDAQFFHQGAAVFRFAVQYPGRAPCVLLPHFTENDHHVLVAKRCWNCNRPILCRPCGKLQRRRGLYGGRYMTLEGRYLATWLAAFLPAAQEDGQRR